MGRFGEDEFALCPKTLPKCMYASVADLTKVSIPSVPASSSGLKLSPSNEPTVSLTIMVVPTASGNTQIQVRPDTTTAEVLAAVCQQCHLEHPQNYALLRRDRGELIDMQLKAADFQHVDDLALVERTSMQAQALSNDLGPVLQQPKYKNAMDLITNYKVCNSSTHTTVLCCQPATPHCHGPSRAYPYLGRRLDSHLVCFNLSDF